MHRWLINQPYLTERKIIGLVRICKPMGGMFLEKFSIYVDWFVISKNS